MIKTFADKRTQELYLTGRAKRFPSDLGARAALKLEYLDLAVQVEDLRCRPVTGCTRSTATAGVSTRSQ